MIEHFKEILGEERFNQILQEAEGKTYEELLDEIDTLQQENQKYKEVIDNIKNILTNLIDYREFADLANAIEDVIKEVE